MSRSSDGNIVIKKDRNIVNKADKACSFTVLMTSSSMALAVSGEQAKDVSPPRYWLVTVSKATIPNCSLIPYRVTMALASFVACSMSVSYTHLDVYKRQTRALWRRSFLTRLR